MTLRNAAGKIYNLSPSPIGSGGEGDIYPVTGAGNYVAKIYKPDAMTKELEEKLIVMVNNPPDAIVLTQVAWPLDVVYDDSGLCHGFIMPRLNITHELGEIYKYPSMLPLTTKQKMNIAQNICVVISEVHAAGYVFGDFNPRNIGLDINTGLVSFLDTDTYHVFDWARDRVYRCNVCAPGYAAPELLERCSEFAAHNPSESQHAYAKTPLPTFTKETDNFALAIHMFKLLMNGYTPFGGIIETASVSQSSPGVGDSAVKRDSYCFKPGFKHQSAAIMPLEVFPQEVADLFTRAFMYGKMDPKQRPGANEWHGALERLWQSLKVCSQNPLHYYYQENRNCPLCEADERYAIAIGVKSETTNTARLSQMAYDMPEQVVSTASSKLNGNLATIAGVIDNTTKSVQTSKVQTNSSQSTVSYNDDARVTTNAQVNMELGFAAPGKELLVLAGVANMIIGLLLFPLEALYFGINRYIDAMRVLSGPNSFISQVVPAFLIILDPLLFLVLFFIGLMAVVNRVCSQNASKLMIASVISSLVFGVHSFLRSLVFHIIDSLGWFPFMHVVGVYFGPPIFLTLLALAVQPILFYGAYKNKRAYSQHIATPSKPHNS